MGPVVSETADRIKAEQEALASLQGTRGWEVLRIWMEAEMNRAIQTMMDERRREESLKAWAREAKTFQKVIQRVESAARQLRREPF